MKNKRKCIWRLGGPKPISGQVEDERDALGGSLTRAGSSTRVLVGYHSCRFVVMSSSHAVDFMLADTQSMKARRS